MKTKYIRCMLIDSKYQLHWLSSSSNISNWFVILAQGSQSKRGIKEVTAIAKQKIGIVSKEFESSSHFHAEMKGKNKKKQKNYDTISSKNPYQILHSTNWNCKAANALAIANIYHAINDKIEYLLMPLNSATHLQNDIVQNDLVCGAIAFTSKLHSTFTHCFASE